jgi:hypothetical protein
MIQLTDRQFVVLLTVLIALCLAQQQQQLPAAKG